MIQGVVKRDRFGAQGSTTFNSNLFRPSSWVGITPQLVAVDQALIRVQPWAMEDAAEALAAPQVLALDRLAPGWAFRRTPLPAGAMPPWEGGPWRVVVDADLAGDHLSVRARRPRERFQPLGLGGRSAKLSDFMINQRVPTRPTRATISGPW